MESYEDIEGRSRVENNNNNNNYGVTITRSLSHSVWDDFDSEWKSWLIPLFMAFNLLFFLIIMFVNNCPSHGSTCVSSFLGRFSFEPLQYNPLLGPSPYTLMKMGAITWSVVVKQHQVWRLFTSIWVHTGVIHLLVNMLCLFFIGIRLEQQFGFWRIGIIYLLSGIGGNMASCLFYPNHISVGPTSALLGLIGSMFAELLTNMIYYTNKVIAGLTLLLMLVINLVITIVPHPHNGGPIAGFIVGILVGFILLPRPNIGWYPYDQNNSKPKFKRHQYVLGIVSLVLLVIGYILGLIMLFRT